MTTTRTHPATHRHAHADEPFGLSHAALERIAADAGAADADCARRILLAYWFSKERAARDEALAAGRLRPSD